MIMIALNVTRNLATIVNIYRSCCKGKIGYDEKDILICPATVTRNRKRRLHAVLFFRSY